MRTEDRIRNRLSALFPFADTIETSSRSLIFAELHFETGRPQLVGDDHSHQHSRSISGAQQNLLRPQRRRSRSLYREHRLDAAQPRPAGRIARPKQRSAIEDPPEKGSPGCVFEGQRQGSTIVA